MMINQSRFLNSRELRKFGFTFSVMIAFFLGVLVPFIWGSQIVLMSWPWTLALFFSFWSLIWPSGLRPVHRVWMVFGDIMAWVNTRLVLAILFFGVFAAFGLSLRLLAKDPLNRKLDPNTKSYRVQSRLVTRKHMEKPY